jgi:hypothetical protein
MTVTSVPANGCCANPTQRATIKSAYVSFTGASLSRLGCMKNLIIAVLPSMLFFSGTLGTCAARERKSAPDVNGPRVFSLPRAALQQIKSGIAAGKIIDPALDQLRSDADTALKQAPLSVTLKSIKPPSGDKHDYMSLAPYWWPDPAKPNGLPYIRRDGQVNPEIEQVQDHKNMNRVISAVHTLALAYYFFQEEAYAAHATELLRTWFLNPETRMNPNLEFAQGVRGFNTGRGTGLIETRDVNRLVDAIGLLSGSKSWTAVDQKGMEEWCARFLDWMMHSQNGKDEAAAKNNHGSYYDVQVASLALFTGKTEIARSVLRAVGGKRVAMQIELDGRQPLELERTKALGYSVMNLAGLFELGLLGEDVGVDLWNFRTPDGRNIHKALDYLVPFVTREQKWPYQQIIDFKAAEISPVLTVAAVKYKDRLYEDLAAKIDPALLRRIDVFPFRRLLSQ